MRKLLFLHSLLVLLLIAGMADAGTILTSGVWSVNNHEYVLVELLGASWATATSDMNSLLGSGYYLATITSQAEQGFVESLVGNFTGEYWLGAYQDPYHAGQGPGDDWNWVTGEPWNYENWYGGEPNDNYGSGSEQEAAIWSSDGWRWNDEGNLGNMTGYLAESSVPEPGTLILLGTGLAGIAGYGRLQLRRRKKE